MAKQQDPDFDVQLEFEKLKSQVTDLVQTLKENGEQKAANLQEKIASSVEDYKDSALKKAQQVQAVGSDGVAQVETYVKANPVASIAIAFGVGFVLSRLLGGRN